MKYENKLHRAHIPFISSEMDQNYAKCLLCHQSRPSLTHRFWACSYISSFWDQVLDYIFEVTLLKLPKDPLLLIFGYWDPQLLPWSLICLLISRRTILKNWTLSHCPNTTQIKQELLLLLFKEWANTDFKHETSKTHFYSMWEPFMLSALSPEDLVNFNQYSLIFWDFPSSCPGESDSPDGQPITCDR